MININKAQDIFRNKTTDSVVSFKEKAGIVPRFIKQQQLTQKEAADLNAELVKRLGVNEALERVFNDDSTLFVEEMLTRNDIAFQAINNGISQVERVLEQHNIKQNIKQNNQSGFIVKPLFYG